MDTTLFTLMRGQGRQSGLDALVSQLNSELGRQTGSLSPDIASGVVMATESLAGDQARCELVAGEVSRLQDVIASAVAGIESVNLNTMGIESLSGGVAVGGETQSNRLSDLSLTAAGYLAAAFASPVAYAEKALSRHESFGPGVKELHVVSHGNAGSIRHEQAMGLESFSEQPLRQMMGWSIVMAATGAKQDPFTEAFFRTFWSVLATWV